MSKRKKKTAVEQSTSAVSLDPTAEAEADDASFSDVAEALGLPDASDELREFDGTGEENVCVASAVVGLGETVVLEADLSGPPPPISPVERAAIVAEVVEEIAPEPFTDAPDGHVWCEATTQSVRARGIVDTSGRTIEKLRPGVRALMPENTFLTHAKHLKRV
jgi:hypothetical protein